MADTLVTIRQMLDSVRTQQKQLKDRLEMLDRREDTLLEWLNEEEPVQQVLIPDDHKNGSTRLSAFIQSKLADGKSHRTEDLAKLAKEQGLIDRMKSSNRVINMTMQGLYQHKIVKRNTDGSWERRLN
jgi:hypothetical protein